MKERTSGSKRQQTSVANAPLRSAFGKALATLRTEKGLSKRKLAQAADLSYAYVARIEAGSQRASFDALAALAGALEVSPSEIYTLAESEALYSKTEENALTAPALADASLAYASPGPDLAPQLSPRSVSAETEGGRSRFFHSTSASAIPAPVNAAPAVNLVMSALRADVRPLEETSKSAPSVQPPSATEFFATLAKLTIPQQAHVLAYMKQLIARPRDTK